MICPKCNNEIDEKSKFCPYCGSTVENAKAKSSDRRTSKLLIAVLCAVCAIFIGVCFFMNSSNKKAVQEAYESGYEDGINEFREEYKMIQQSNNRLSVIISELKEHRERVDNSKMFIDGFYGDLEKITFEGNIDKVLNNSVGMKNTLETVLDSMSKIVGED